MCGHRARGDGRVFGAGDGGPLHSMLNHEMAELISKNGAIGVADGILQEMLEIQEVA